MQSDLERQSREEGSRTYRKENSSEERLRDGGFRKSYYSESVTIYGPGSGGNPTTGNTNFQPSPPFPSLARTLAEG